MHGAKVKIETLCIGVELKSLHTYTCGKDKSGKNVFMRLLNFTRLIIVYTAACNLLDMLPQSYANSPGNRIAKVEVLVRVGCTYPMKGTQASKGPC